MPVNVFSAGYLDAIARDARASARRRMHRNVHASAADPCQRLFNAIEPDSYIRPHRHAVPPLAETIIAVRGAFLCVEFDDLGGVMATCRFGAAADPAGAAGVAAGVEVLPGTWHTIISLFPGSVFFEAKAGPYDPSAPRDFAAWAPAEGTPESARWWHELREALGVAGSP